MLLGSFTVTRIVLVYIGAHPGLYAGADIGVDVFLYEGWAQRIVGDAAVPYADVAIEYPPGALPFILLPALGAFITPLSYRVWFALSMVALDGLGLLGVIRLSAREASPEGPWLWVAGLPLLGPVVWLRLDLIPAVATVWAMERAGAGGWRASGGLLSFGALAKVLPAFLLPATVAAAGRRVKVVVGAGAVAIASLGAFATVLPDLFTSVVTYHLERGVQLESTLGIGLLLAGYLGHPVDVVFRFGAYETVSTWAPRLGLMSTVAALSVVAASVWLAWETRGRAPALADVWFTVVVLLLATGRVLSPQFLVWAVAAAAAAVASRHTKVRGPILLMMPTLLLTQLLYPFAYDALLNGDRAAVVLLVVRNSLLAATGVWAVALILSRRAGRVAA